MDNREAQINYILQSLERLPPDAQQGMAWIINHFAFAEEMCRNSEFAPGELEASIQHAMDKKDFSYWRFSASVKYCKSTTINPNKRLPRTGTAA